jgi:hypothetical protein
MTPWTLVGRGRSTKLRPALSIIAKTTAQYPVLREAVFARPGVPYIEVARVNIDVATIYKLSSHCRAKIHID